MFRLSRDFGLKRFVLGIMMVLLVFSPVHSMSSVSAQEEPDTMDVSVTKEWVGEEGDLATVFLVANGERQEKMDLHAGNDWSHVFEGVPLTDSDGNVIDYTIVEAPLDGYETEVSGSLEDGFTVTNTKIVQEPEATNIPVRKVWIGEEGDLATVFLVANGERQEKMDLHAGNDWSHVFEGVPLTDPDGNVIDYTIVEAPLDGYETEVSGSMEDGFTVTNTEIVQEPEPNVHSVYIQKIWVDDGPENRPDTVSFVIAYPIGNETGEDIIELDSETGELIRAENEWGEISLDNIEYDHWAVGDGFQFEAKVNYNKEDGDLLVTEVPVDGYETTVDQDGNYFNFTNTAVEEEPEPNADKVYIQKTWEDDGSENRPDTVTFEFEVLYEDGETDEATLELDSETGDIVRATDQDGEVPPENIDYDHWAVDDGFQFEVKVLYRKATDEMNVREVPIDGYETTVDQDGNYFHFTNTAVEEGWEPVNNPLVLSKEWDDASGEDRPDTLTFTVVSEMGITRIVDVIEVDAETGEIVDLRYQYIDDNGDAITDWVEELPIENLNYTYQERENGFVFELDYYAGNVVFERVEEDPVEGYEAAVDIDGTDVTVINTAVSDDPPLDEETIDITVTKEWVGKKQDSATVYLVINGQRYEEGEVVLSEENDWNHTYEGFYESIDGYDFEFTIEEEEMEGYEVDITGSIEDGFVVTNTEVKEDPPAEDPEGEEEEKDDPQDDPEVTVEAGDDDGQALPKTATHMYNWIVVGAIILIVGMMAVVLSRRKKV